jgi:hypothetical protein
MALRLMLATAAALGLGAAVVLLLPEPAAEHVASRAEVMAALASSPLPHVAALLACAPVPAPVPAAGRVPADI